jgi:UDP-N-acetylmuramoyl-tripeptide--D-alanyl-D-alanine ligase
MSIRLTSQEIASMITTDVLPTSVLPAAVIPASEGFVIEGVEFDSRNIKGGELFIALPGEKFDGESFVVQALKNGAAAALVRQDKLSQEIIHAASGKEGGYLFVVKDTLQAFTDLARKWREQLNIPILAITGSVGKTTTKEILAGILLKHAPGAYAKKSFNNQTGVPYSILKLTKDHNWGVLELGMNHAGEISHLTKIAKPTLAAITRIAPAHIGNLGSMEAIARAKLEIIDGLKAGSHLIINGDDQVLEGELKKIDTAHLKILRFGSSREHQAQISEINSSFPEGGVTFKLKLGSETQNINMRGAVGEQYAFNATCALLAARAAIPEISLVDSITALESFTPPDNRLKVYHLKDGRTIIDDSYNANPVSMHVMLNTAAKYISSGKKVALLLGEMRELGSFSKAYHLEIARAISKLKVSALFTVGKETRVYIEENNGRGEIFESYQEAADEIKKCDFEILLIKGSRAINLDKAVQLLLN